VTSGSVWFVTSGVASSSGVSSSSESSSDESSSDSVSSTGGSSSLLDIQCLDAETLLDGSENGAQSVIGCTRGRNASEILRVSGEGRGNRLSSTLIKLRYEQ
jgi:hypothetical protein